jgi:hypothetical protein
MTGSILEKNGREAQSRRGRRSVDPLIRRKAAGLTPAAQRSSAGGEFPHIKRRQEFCTRAYFPNKRVGNFSGNAIFSCGHMALATAAKRGGCQGGLTIRESIASPIVQPGGSPRPVADRPVSRSTLERRTLWRLASGWLDLHPTNLTAL